MELTVPLDEAVAAARAAGMLPAAVTEVTGEGSAVRAKVAVHELPEVPGPIRAATRFTGPVDVAVSDAGVSGRTWTVSVVAAHPRIPIDLSGFVADALRGRVAAAPAGLAAVRTQDGQVLLDVDLDEAGALLARELSARITTPVPVVRIDTVALGENLRVVAVLG